MQTDLRIGVPVTFFDPHGAACPAIVTAVHGQTTVEARNEWVTNWYAEGREKGLAWATDEAEAAAKDAPFITPSVNVVFVSRDDSKTDSYGRQIDRATSVPHKGNQSAHGYYYE